MLMWKQCRSIQWVRVVWLRCRVGVEAATTSGSAFSHHELSDVNCRPSSGHVTSLIETLQPPPPQRFPVHTCSRSLIDELHAQTSTARSISSAGGQSTLVDAVLGGVELSLAAVVLGASSTASPSSSSKSPAVTPASTARRLPEMRIHVTTDSPERATVTSPSRVGQPAGARPASGVGRRSAGVPHGSVRAFQQQQQQRLARPVAQHHNTLLVVPSSSRSASSSPSMFVGTRGGSVSTSPSSASPSPSPEPVSRHSDYRSSHACHSIDTSRSLSTQRPLGVTRTPAVGTDDQSKPSRSCVHQRQLTDCQTSRTDELHQQETFVWRRTIERIQLLTNRIDNSSILYTIRLSITLWYIVLGQPSLHMTAVIRHYLALSAKRLYYVHVFIIRWSFHSNNHAPFIDFWLDIYIIECSSLFSLYIFLLCYKLYRNKFLIYFELVYIWERG